MSKFQIKDIPAFMRGRFLKFWLPPIIWALVIFSFSSHPTGSASQIVWTDFAIKKMAHIFVYAVLSTLLYRAFLSYKLSKETAAFYGVLISFLYGISDEFHQSFTPGRMPKAMDVGFDTIGAVLAIYLIWKLLPILPRKLRKLAENLDLI